MSRALALAGLVLLAGCSELGLGDLSGNRPRDTCGMSRLGRFVGVPASPEVLAEIAAKVGDQNLRPIRPGDIYTTDLRPDRLDLYIGAGGRIERMECG